MYFNQFLSAVSRAHLLGLQKAGLRFESREAQPIVIPKQPFSPQDANDVNNLILCAIENTSWWNEKLAILTRPWQRDAHGRRAFFFGGLVSSNAPNFGISERGCP